jgi:hypothetical protein
MTGIAVAMVFAGTPLLGLLTLLGPMQPAWADASGITASCAAGGAGLSDDGYTVLADAEPLLVSANDSKAPVVPQGVDVVDLTPATAQAELDNLQQSEAFAGSPDIGPFVDTLPDTVDGLLSGQAPTLPSFPFSATSTVADPTDSQVQGPYSVKATTTPLESAGMATIGATASTGVSGIQAFADSTVNPDCSVTATAIATVDALNLGPAINLGDITTDTVVTEPLNGTPVVTTKITIGTITLPALGPLGLTQDGLTIAGTSSTLPNTAIAALSKALQTLGVTIQFLPAIKTTQTLRSGAPSGVGVESAGLMITYEPNVPTQGEVPVTLTIGRSFVSVANAAGGIPPLSVTSLLPTSSGYSPSTPLSTLPLASGPSALNTAGASSGAPNGQISGERESLATVEHSVGPIFSADDLYLVLILTAMALVFGGQLFRLLAVRLALSQWRWRPKSRSINDR